MSRSRSVAALALLCAAALFAPSSSLRAVSPNLVISQVYGGGGNSGAIYTHDYIEIYNRGDAPASMAGMSLQYASATGTGNFGANSGQLTELPDVTLNPGQYFLVREATGGSAGAPLPTPDLVDGSPINMSATAGKVALVTGTATLGCNGGSIPCSADQLARIVDLVGFGGANFYEGVSPAPAASNTLAVLRVGGGDIDTDNNGTDFMAGTPDPRTSAGIALTGTGLAMPATVANGEMSLLTVTVSPADLPPSTGITVTADLSTIGGSASQAFVDDGTDGDAIAGDLVYSFDAVVTGTPGSYSLPFTVADAQSRTADGTIQLAIEPPFTPIFTLQGSGSRSTFDGDLVVTRGIVTARKSNGFFIQVRDAESDGDPQTSDGIFVFTSSAPPPAAAAGNEVRVMGTLQEFSPASAPGQPPLSEISGSPVVTLLTSGNPLPAPAVLQPSFTTTTGGLEQLERFEGMRVTADVTAIAPTRSFSRNSTDERNGTSRTNGDFHVVLRGVTRPVREPGYDPSETLPPGSPAGVPAFDGNPERLRVDSDGQVGAASIEIAAGQMIDGLTGVLDYGFWTYTILPDPGTTYVPEGDTTAEPISAAGDNEFTVGSYNVERFYDTVADPNVDDPVMFPDGLERRLAKASLAIRNVLLAPDILALVEVENLGLLQTIAARVNGDAVDAGQPDPMYTAHLLEGNDGGGIDVGFLVKSARVDVISVEQVGKDATFVDPSDGSIDLLNDRPPLVLRAAIHGPAGSLPYPVTVIANHLRSLIGMTEAGGEGARVRQKRALQAEFLADYIQSLQAADANERIISVGDYNAFPFNDGFVDVMGTIKGAPTPADQVVLASPDLMDPNLVNAGDTLGQPGQYSYVFDGHAQAIDHILVNLAAFRRFSRMAYAHVGADFPESFRADATRPERLSDHDAAIACFAFPGAPVITLVGGSEITVEAYQPFVDPGYSAYDDDLGAVPVTVTGEVNVNVPGTYVLTYFATNGFLSTTVTRTVHVADRTAPVISGFILSPDILWPPNHTMMEVSASYTAMDASGTVFCSLDVESNEPADGLGDGDTETDSEVLDAARLLLRAERSGTGTGRMYNVTLTCTDGAGNRAQVSGAVMVPLRR